MDEDTPEVRRAELMADVAEAEAQRDWASEFVDAMRPWMEGTDRTLATALAAMPPEERDRAVLLGVAAGMLVP